MRLSYSNEAIEFDQGAPRDYSGLVIPGSKFLTATKEFGKFFTQEITGENYSLRYSIFYFFQKITLQAKSAAKGLCVRLMQKNKITHQIKGLGKISSREGHYAMFALPGGNCKPDHKEKEYRTLDLFYHRSLAKQLIEFFPRLEKILAIHKDHPLSINKRALSIKPGLQDLVNGSCGAPMTHVSHGSILTLRFVNFYL